MKTILSLTATLTLLGLISLAVAESKSTKPATRAKAAASTESGKTAASTAPLACPRAGSRRFRPGPARRYAWIPSAPTSQVIPWSISLPRTSRPCSMNRGKITSIF